MTVKKTISLLLSVLMLISIFTVCPLTANAEDDEIINQFNCVEYLEKAGVNIASLHNTLVNGFSQCKTNISLSSFNINRYTYEYATKAIHRYLYYYIPDYYCFISDNVCYSNGSTVSYLDVTYDERFNTPQKLSEAHSQIESAENKILQDIKGNDNLTEVEKALLVHDRLVALIDYDKGYYDDNIDPDSYYLYSALVKRKAVCNGYSIAYSYLMNKIGIKTYLVRSDNLNHAWNITYINNKPYYVDVTWDDPIIIGTGTIPDRVKYKFFLVGKSNFSNAHREDGDVSGTGQNFKYPTLSESDYR
jgi:transglutaminase/protease-like cytokinesis protein 3